jgi:hypothetical protein
VRRERGPQTPAVDLLFRPSPLESGLGLDNAILDCLEAIAARERAPGTNPERLSDHIRVDEDGAGMTHRRRSQLAGRLNAVRREQVHEILDR